MVALLLVSLSIRYSKRQEKTVSQLVSQSVMCSCCFCGYLLFILETYYVHIFVAELICVVVSQVEVNMWWDVRHCLLDTESLLVLQDHLACLEGIVCQSEGVRSAIRSGGRFKRRR